MANNKNRIEKDSFGEIEIQADKKWGAQTQRSLGNFPIGNEKMPRDLIYSYALIKEVAALTNTEVGNLPEEKMQYIVKACQEIQDRQWDEEFPLSVWQTGSGTQTNMNLNEVIAYLANQKSEKSWIHPNDDVNMGQSTNDTFPTAIHLAGAVAINNSLLPTLVKLQRTLNELETEYKDIIKLGRTHLQDATPVTFGQEISGWKEMIKQSRKMIEQSMSFLYQLPLGGTAVGTGLNTHQDFSKLAISKLAEKTKLPFEETENKFHGLASKDAVVNVHGALKTLATNMMKIANDIRWLGSGPRSGLGEIKLPPNEPGSSIMPGKVNPTQIEALTMVCVQVMGNDTTISIAASQGNFELNVYMPLIGYNFLQSIHLLSDSINSFNDRCLIGLEANEEKMLKNVEDSLALATALTPYIGYEKASTIAQKAEKNNLPLREAAIQSKIISAEEYDKFINLSKMV